ncbi:hypothetical protein ACFWIW_14125 [Amycolatopsis sp. NPDC058340]|uniref:hypothetical protein n=1 Tax=Amycolatopsis sp. NPDC058340 TaxID=3346453 RepID=UPI00364DD585
MPNTAFAWSVTGNTFVKTGSKPTAKAAWTAARDYADPRLKGVGDMVALTVNGLTTSVTKATLHSVVRERITAASK